jgi:hypothetical protein
VQFRAVDVERLHDHVLESGSRDNRWLFATEGWREGSEAGDGNKERRHAADVVLTYNQALSDAVAVPLSFGQNRNRILQGFRHISSVDEKALQPSAMCLASSTFRLDRTDGFSIPATKLSFLRKFRVQHPTVLTTLPQKELANAFQTVDPSVSSAENSSSNNDPKQLSIAELKNPVEVCRALLAEEVLAKPFAESGRPSQYKTTVGSCGLGFLSKMPNGGAIQGLAKSTVGTG